MSVRSGESTAGSNPAFLKDDASDRISGTFGLDDSSTSGTVDSSLIGIASNPSKARKSSSISSARNSSIIQKEFTINKLQFASLGQLFGRDEEIKQLEEGFARISTAEENTNPRQFTTIGGAAGTGKSVLALEVKNAALQKKGFFLAGKFEMHAREEPYSAFADACQHIVEDLIFLQQGSKETGEESFNRWQFSFFDEFVTKLKAAVDKEDMEVLRAIIPSLGRLIDPEAAEPAYEEGKNIDYMELKQSVQYSFGQFVQVLTSFGPLVMVFDDLQWVDDASIELMEYLLTDSQSGSLMIVGTYRDNEIDGKKDHVFTKTLDSLKSKGDAHLTVTEMKIGNLSEPYVSQMMENLLSASVKKVKELVECVHRKTEGNAFYVRQFLLFLQRKELLTFNFGLMKWQWDVDKINAKSMVTENVVALLDEKLKQLPQMVQTLLPRVACIGSQFTASSFKVLTEKYCTGQDLDTLLEEHEANSFVNGSGMSRKKKRSSKKYTLLDLLESEGLIVFSRDVYKWEHDKIKESALGLVDPKELPSIQFEIGNLLLAKLPETELNRLLFVVTKLLNAKADVLAEEDPKRLQVAELNLRSGKAALGASAFSLAADYLARGVNLLIPSQKWDKPHFDMTLEMYSNAAEANLCIGNHEKTKELFDEVMNIPTIDAMAKRRLYNARLQSLSGQGETVAAMNLALEVLALVGCKFPKRGRQLHGLMGIIGLTSSLKKTTAKIDSLPPVNDLRLEWIFYLLDRLSTYTFQCDPVLAPLTFLKSYKMTVKHGISEVSGPNLAIIGLLVAGIIGDLAGGKRLGELALKFMTRRTKARTMFLSYEFALHYQIPFKNCKKPLLEAYEAGMKSGDLESAGWSVSSFLELQIFTGAKLEDVLEDYRVYCVQMEHHKQDKIVLNTKMCWQVAENLALTSSEGHKLKGDIIDEDELKAMFEGKPEYAHERNQLYRYRTLAAFWFNEHKLVVQLMLEQGYHEYSFEKVSPGALPGIPLYMHCALSCVSVARDCKDKKERATHLSYAKKFLTKIKQWSKKGNPNCQHGEHLIEAEIAAIKGDRIAAKRSYDLAILVAGRWGLTNEHALAHERFADFSRLSGDMDDARHHYKLALELYEDWGAFGRQELLQSSIRDLLLPVRSITFGQSGRSSALYAVDESVDSGSGATPATPTSALTPY